MVDRCHTDLPLILRPHDVFSFIGTCTWKDRLGRHEPSALYVVVHQGRNSSLRDLQTAWTHVYRVAVEQLGCRTSVYLEAVAEGDCMEVGVAKAKLLMG